FAWAGPLEPSDKSTHALMFGVPLFERFGFSGNRTCPSPLASIVIVGHGMLPLNGLPSHQASPMTVPVLEALLELAPAGQSNLGFAVADVLEMCYKTEQRTRVDA